MTGATPPCSSADRVETWIGEAVTAGARRIGGERLSKTTLKPTILVDPPRDAKVSMHEIFGPVTCVYGFDEIDEGDRRGKFTAGRIPGEHFHV